MELTAISRNEGSVLVGNRRGRNRFPLCEEVQYKLCHRKQLIIVGTGKTLNISSGGVLFTTEEMLPLGCPAELSVHWPVRLNGTCPLKFVACGRIIRTEADRAAVRIERYEFRTRSTHQEAPAGPPDMGHWAGNVINVPLPIHPFGR
jgi:hypothetical protein